MQTSDQGRGLAGGEELGELDDEGDEEDEIVLDARQSNRPQGERTRLLTSVSITGVGIFFLSENSFEKANSRGAKAESVDSRAGASGITSPLTVSSSISSLATVLPTQQIRLSGSTISVAPLENPLLYQ